MKAQQYKGFTIRKGDLKFTHEVNTITKGKGINEEYYGGADTVAIVKQKIDSGKLVNLYKIYSTGERKKDAEN